MCTCRHFKDFGFYPEQIENFWKMLKREVTSLTFILKGSLLLHAVGGAE